MAGQVRPALRSTVESFMEPKAPAEWGLLRLALIHHFEVTVALKHSFTVSVFSVSVTASPSSPFSTPETESVFEMQVLTSTALQN